MTSLCIPFYLIGFPENNLAIIFCTFQQFPFKCSLTNIILNQSQNLHYLAWPMRGWDCIHRGTPTWCFILQYLNLCLPAPCPSPPAPYLLTFTFLTPSSLPGQDFPYLAGKEGIGQFSQKDSLERWFQYFRKKVWKCEFLFQVGGCFSEHPLSRCYTEGDAG